MTSRSFPDPTARRGRVAAIADVAYRWSTVGRYDIGDHHTPACWLLPFDQRAPTPSGPINLSFDTGDLPYLDEHQTRIAASRDVVWPALRRYVDSSLRMGEGNPLAWLLGTVPRPGFEVSREVPHQQLSMAGRHRFSRYLLVFELADVANGETMLSARSYAAFPGLHGRVYRALVIGTRGHVVAVEGMLRSIRRSSLG